MVVLTLTSYDDVFEQRNELSWDGECIAIVEATWRRTKDGSKGVVSVEKEGSFGVDLLADVYDGVVAVLLVLDNLPILLDDDRSLINKKEGINLLSNLQRKAQEWGAIGTIGNGGFWRADIHEWEETPGKTGDILHAESRTFCTFSADGGDGLGFGFTPCVVVV